MVKKGHFVAKSHFRNLFRSCEMRGWGCEMALMCQRWVLQLRNGAWAAKWRFGSLGWFHRGFHSYKIGAWAMKWHSCAKGMFLREWLWGCEMVSQMRAHFATNPWFHSKSLLAAKLFRRGWPFLQGATLGCEISQATEISCFWAPFGFLRPSFTSFAIPPKLDHSKSLSYIKIT